MPLIYFIFQHLTWLRDHLATPTTFSFITWVLKHFFCVSYINMISNFIRHLVAVFARVKTIDLLRVITGKH